MAEASTHAADESESSESDADLADEADNVIFL